MLKVMSEAENRFVEKTSILRKIGILKSFIFEDYEVLGFEHYKDLDFDFVCNHTKEHIENFNSSNWWEDELNYTGLLIVPNNKNAMKLWFVLNEKKD